MNILILTGRFGMGHYSVAKALGEQVSAAYPGARVRVADLFTETFGSNTGLLYKAYTFFINRGGKIYNQIYTKAEDGNKEMSIPLKNLFLRTLDRLLTENGSHLVISTLPFTSQLMGEYKQHYGCSLPLVTCITDVCSHGDWINPYTDAYLVAAEQTKWMLVQRGVAAGRISVTGVPVRRAFVPGVTHRGDQTRELLIMGGGLGLMPKNRRFYAAIDRMEGVHTTVICGDNQELRSMLEGRYEHISVEGFVPDVERYLRHADLMLSKPGGVTLFEAIACHVPLLAFQPFLGQEVRNGQFIEENGIGAVLTGSSGESLPQIEALIRDGAKLDTMRRNMAELHDLQEPDALLRLLSFLSMGGRCA